MARRATAKSEVDRLTAAVAELQQELARLRASRRCSCLACTGAPLTPGAVRWPVPVSVGSRYRRPGRTGRRFGMRG
jgi:hypothetical protein